MSPRSILAPLLVLVLAAAVIPAGSRAADPSDAPDGRTLNVPADHPTLEAAIAASQPGDVIVLGPGTYPGDVKVPEDKPGITIRGVDRNTVIFDGQDIRHNAIDVEADGVVLENMTAHSFVENGFYWDGVEGYAGRYLTVWNVGLYAIYAIESRGGVIEDSYVSGAADAAFYVGECHPCDTTLRNLTAILSAVGYSGTNAGGNLIVEDSLFDRNAIGILPNSYDVNLEPPPQREATFRRNVVRGSDTVATPRNTPLGGFAGVGIGIAGGVDNIVIDNEVTGSARYGIAVFATVDRTTGWAVSGNQVSRNRVSGSGIADIVLADGSGVGNCFKDNQAEWLLPLELEARCSAEGDGHATVATHLVQPPPFLLEGLPEAPPYSDMPAPPLQPSMPAPAAVADAQLNVALVAAAMALAGVVVLIVGQAGLTREPGRRARWVRLLWLGAGMAILGGLATILSLVFMLGGRGATTTPSSSRAFTTGAGATPQAGTQRVFTGVPLDGVFDSCLPGCDLYLVSSDGTQPVNLTQTGGDQQESAPSVSPDGSRVAFRCASPQPEPVPPPATPTPVPLGRLCVVDFLTRTMTPILEDPEIDYGAPAWAPDGASIAVAFTRLDGTSGIALTDASGRDARVVLDGPDGVANPSWSPNDARIAYSCATGSTAGGPDVLQLCVMSSDGTDRRQLARIDGTCGAPSIAPDGFILAVVCFGEEGEGGNLYQVGIGEGQAVPVTDDGSIAPEGQARPAWIRSGGTVFVRRDDALWAMDVVARTWSLTSMPPLHGDFALAPPID